MTENAIQTTEKKEVAKDQRSQELALIKTSLTGDWSAVTDNVKTAFVQKLCEELHIPLALNPFRFIKAKGGTKLYAGAEAASLIGAYNNASVKIISKSFDKDTMIYSVVAECSNNYKAVQDEAHLFIGKTLGEDRANAIMKCITKAKRRAVLSAFGLSARDYDEREEMIQPAEPVKQLEPVSEDQEARMELFEYLTDENGLFKNDAQKATEFVLEKTSKPINSLNAEECSELMGQINTEIEDNKPDPNQTNLFPSPENNGGL